MTVTVRTATVADAPLIASFNQFLALETEGKTLPEATIVQGVSTILGDATRGSYYLACDAERVVGQLMITFEWSDWRDGWFWWIQSVYVEKDARKLGVFRTLYQHVKTLARERPDVCGIRLYVEKDNTRAQSTYTALGMATTPYLIMEEEFAR
ncbi:MAG: GNAT family N-acetyltransferase [Pseudomonadota bacterium]